MFLKNLKNPQGAICSSEILIFIKTNPKFLVTYPEELNIHKTKNFVIESFKNMLNNKKLKIDNV
jgi:hypothetical protein